MGTVKIIKHSFAFGRLCNHGTVHTGAKSPVRLKQYAGFVRNADDPNAAAIKNGSMAPVKILHDDVLIDQVR